MDSQVEMTCEILGRAHSVANSACAMVPVAPNELTRPSASRKGESLGSDSRTGSRKRASLMREFRCGFSCLSCAFGAMQAVESGTANNDAVPAPPATASRWPRLALSEVDATSTSFSACAAAPTSIGSPKAVPVP